MFHYNDVNKEHSRDIDYDAKTNKNIKNMMMRTTMKTTTIMKTITMKISIIAMTIMMTMKKTTVFTRISAAALI